MSTENQLPTFCWSLLPPSSGQSKKNKLCGHNSCITWANGSSGDSHSNPTGEGMLCSRQSHGLNTPHKRTVEMEQTGETKKEDSQLKHMQWKECLHLLALKRAVMLKLCILLQSLRE
jgi:hypothetical protein